NTVTPLAVRSPARMCRLLVKESHMATNLALDQELLDRAFRVSGEPTKKAAVTRALQEFIARREQRRVAELFGKLEWDTTFDYKAERARKR
ncbi:MAG: type II toxin-antitoxin system VapB family antitoxin, partial [Rubrivivax sp.]